MKDDRKLRLEDARGMGCQSIFKNIDYFRWRILSSGVCTPAIVYLLLFFQTGVSFKKNVRQEIYTDQVSYLV